MKLDNHAIIERLKYDNNLKSDSKLAELLQCSRSHVEKYKKHTRTDDTDTLLLQALLSADDEADIKQIILDVLLQADNNVKQRMIQLALSKRIGKDSP